MQQHNNNVILYYQYHINAHGIMMNVVILQIVQIIL